MKIPKFDGTRSSVPGSFSLPFVEDGRPNPAEADSREWGIVECFQNLYKRRLFLVCATAAGILAAMFISCVQPRLYQSEASLEIREVNENFLNTREIYPTVSSAESSAIRVQTQAEMLQQDVLIEQVVKTLHLDRSSEYQSGVTLWGRLHGSSAPGPTADAALQNATAMVKKNVAIVPARGSRIIRIVSAARNPQLAADIANTLAHTFIEQNIKVRQDEARRTYDSLSLQRDEFRDQLARLDAQVTSAVCRPQPALGLTRRVRFDEGSIPTTKLSVCDGLRREAEADRRFYESISQRVNEARVAAAIPQTNISLVSQAQPSKYPYKPNLGLNVALGMLGGLIFGVGVATLQGQTDTSLSAPGESGRYLALPELGVIPKVEPPNPALSGLLGFTTGAVGHQPVLVGEFSALSEAFRSTVASILSVNSDSSHPHALVVTSSRPSEGKTFVVSNLGIGLTEVGARVLLIDGDMRRPRLHRVFEEANSWGLSEILREQNAIEELPLNVLVKKTTVSGLYLLPSGTCADNVFGLLWSGRMARLVARFRQEFDYLLLDAPPCLEFADARIMARYADQVLLVVRANHTERRAAQAAVQRLFLDGTSVMGVVLNDCDSARGDLYPSAWNYGSNPEGLQ